MVRVGAVGGGEGNGGVWVPELHPMRDAAVGIAITLQAMTEQDADLDGLERRLSTYALRKTVVAAETWNGDELVAALTARFGPAEEDRRDGVRLAWDRKWLQVRGSNMEPVVRLFAESPGEDEAAELQTAAVEMLRG